MKGWARGVEDAAGPILFWERNFRAFGVSKQMSVSGVSNRVDVFR